MLISVIIPVFNGERYLTECLESVKACPSTEVECIIINDGSADDTALICRQSVRDDSRFRLIDKDNSGVSDSRNRGLAEASGDYIFFLDADDYINAPQWSDILTHAEQGAYDMIAYGYYDLFDSGSVKKEQFPKDCDIKFALLSTTMLNTCWGILLRREIISTNSLNFRRELRTCEDAIFILDFAQRAKAFLFSDSCVLYYRINETSVMHRTGLEDRLSDFTTLYERRCNYFSDNNEESIREAMYRQFFSVVTDFFRSYAFDQHIFAIRRDYKKTMKNPAVKEIVAENKMKTLSPGYKKLEYGMICIGAYTLLALYFKLKSWMTAKGIPNG